MEKHKVIIFAGVLVASYVVADIISDNKAPHILVQSVA